MARIIQCMVCKVNFEFEDKELQFLEQLFKAGKIKEVIHPRRCMACRERKKQPLRHSNSPTLAPLKEVSTSLPETYNHNMHDQKVSSLAESHVETTTPQAPAPHAPYAGLLGKMKPALIAPIPVQSEEAHPARLPSVEVHKPHEDLHCVLVAGDFEQLVCRKEVVVRFGNQKVTIVLADIGIQAMKSAMQKAVMHWWNS